MRNIKDSMTEKQEYAIDGIVLYNSLYVGNENLYKFLKKNKVQVYYDLTKDKPLILFFHSNLNEVTTSMHRLYLKFPSDGIKTAFKLKFS